MATKKQVNWTPNKLSQLKKLYRSGLSVKEVAKKMNLGISCINNTMRRHQLPRRTAAETKKIIFEKSPLSFSPKKNLTPEEKKLKIAGLMLYWAEGSKRTQHTVDFANSDPDMIKLFSTFLTIIYQVKHSKLKGMIYCYPSHNIDTLTNFWSKTIGISQSQFTKPYIRQDGGDIRDKMEYGLAHIRYHDKRLFKTIMHDLNNISTCLNKV